MATKPRLGDASTEYVFLDVVGYSKRTIESQAAIIKVLNRIVLESVKTLKLRRDHVIYIPTGDGVCIALIDVSSPFDVQMKIALQILERLHKHDSRAVGELKFQVRVGINSSRDNVIVDINGNPNVSGDGVNMSARIMNEADGGQILVGEPVFGILKKREEYVSAFKILPSVVKHGELLNIYQYARGGLPFLNIDIPSKARPSADARTSSRARRDLKTGGWKIAVEISRTQTEVEWAERAGVVLRQPLKVMALIDTGASVTVINPQVAATCGLRQVGQAAISTTGHVEAAPEYAGAIRFPDSKMKALDPVRFIATALPGSDFSCLIGRDILEKWRLVYDGRTGEVQIEE